MKTEIIFSSITSHLQVTVLVINYNYNVVVFLSCRYNGDAVIKVNMAGGMSAGIKHISVSD